MRVELGESLFSFKVGVAHVSLLFRHARSLKDKRQVIKSLTQRLKNLGFSVSETAFADEPKRGSLGFSFVSSEASTVTRALDEAFRLFVGDFEVLDTQRSVFDYSGEDESSLTEEEDLKFGL